MKLFKKLLILGLFFYLPFTSMAWGVLGHRIVGQIAESYLTPKAKQAIQQILGNESIAMASNWADFIRSDTSYSYLIPMHYINFSNGLNYMQMKEYLSKDTTADAYTELVFLIKQLKNKNIAKEKQGMYLRFLIHLVGDIHQPMHVSRAEDEGGNKIRVMWFREPTSLHAVWDDKLIDFQQLSYTEYTNAINYSTANQRQVWQKEPISEWLYESNQIAEKLYSEIDQNEQKLSYRYNYDHIAILNNQLLKGGIRLAGLLNEIFG
ncbi:MAG TPA: S1/P1 nuclease [Ferruginibacter sp.]|jgi:hypothetical protein|nr:S1/P1 nuclease [Ferruginibacter sp.]